MILDLLQYAIKQAEALGASDAEAYAAINNESEVFIEHKFNWSQGRAWWLDWFLLYQ
jgi:hypothetical protein